MSAMFALAMLPIALEHTTHTLWDDCPTPVSHVLCATNSQVLHTTTLQIAQYKCPWVSNLLCQIAIPDPYQRTVDLHNNTQPTALALLLWLRLLESHLLLRLVLLLLLRLVLHIATSCLGIVIVRIVAHWVC